jgi:prepilin peptidase CpaA
LQVAEVYRKDTGVIDLAGFLRFSYLISLLLIAAVWDLRFHKIPNWLTFPSMIVAIFYHTLSGGTPGFLFSLLGIGTGMTFFIIPYSMGGMGAGDVKLMGAIGGFLGVRGVLQASLWTALVGGLYALALLIYLSHVNKATRPSLSTACPYTSEETVPVTSRVTGKKPCLCYGIAIAVGTLLSMALKIPGISNL